MVLMMTRFCVAALLLVAGCLQALGQGAPSLDTFTSPDGVFQFVYPQNYELLVGERLLKATQGRAATLPVCDFSMALACVIYPIEINEDTRFEAAGFAVDVVPGVKDEPECLTFADQTARSHTGSPQVSSIVINDQVYRHSSAKKKMVGHAQSADLYRAYAQQKCYELQIAVSVADDSATQKAAQTNSLGDFRADRARDSLRLILSSFVFKQ